MDKALRYLALARKGGLAELGEEPVAVASRRGKASLILVAQDATPNTWRRSLHFAEASHRPCVRLPFSKDEMGLAVGRTSLAIAAITDLPLALALLRSLPQPPQEALDALERQTGSLSPLKNNRKGRK